MFYICSRSRRASLLDVDYIYPTLIGLCLKMPVCCINCTSENASLMIAVWDGLFSSPSVSFCFFIVPTAAILLPLPLQLLCFATPSQPPPHSPRLPIITHHSQPYLQIFSYIYSPLFFNTSLSIFKKKNKTWRSKWGKAAAAGVFVIDKSLPACDSSLLGFGRSTESVKVPAGSYTQPQLVGFLLVW